MRERGQATSPREQLLHHVRELERLEEERQAAADALRQGFSNAKHAGFDPATLKVILKMRQMTPEQRQEKRAMEAIYLAALGMLDGDPLTDEARRRLDGRAEPKEPKERRSKSETPAKDDAPPAAPAEPPAPPKDPEEARQEGRDAAAAGKRIYDNPYAAGDPCRAAWDEGWCERSKSHGMDLPAAYQRRTKAPGPDEKGKGSPPPPQDGSQGDDRRDDAA